MAIGQIPSSDITYYAFQVTAGKELTVPGYFNASNSLNVLAAVDVEVNLPPGAYRILPHDVVASTTVSDWTLQNLPYQVQWTTTAPASALVAVDFNNAGKNPTGGADDLTYKTFYLSSTLTNLRLWYVPQWSQPASGSNLDGVIWDGTRYLIHGSNEIFKSTDGVTWTTTASPNNATASIFYGSGETNDYLIVSDGSSATYYTSTDTITWTTRTFPITIDVESIFHDGSTYFFSGKNQTTTNGVIYSSTDGITWTLRYTSASTSKTCGKILYGAGEARPYVVLPTTPSAEEFLNSTDGVTWATIAVPTGYTAGWGGIYDGGSYYGFNRSNSTYTVSTDGITWTTSTITNNLISKGPSNILKAGSDYIFQVNEGGSNTSSNLMVSTNLVNWTTAYRVYPNKGNILTNQFEKQTQVIAYSATATNKYVTLGQNTICASPNLLGKMVSDAQSPLIIEKLPVRFV